MGLLNRRSFLVDVPRGAAALSVVTAAFALGSARGSEAPDAAPLCNPGSDPQLTPVTAPAAPDQETRSRRAQPLPLPSEEAWRQEWLDLISLTSRRPDLGC